MTNVAFKETPDAYIVEIEGHAGFMPGNDIVCAAASVLAYTLMQRLLDLPDNTLIDYGPGTVYITARPKSREAKEAIDTIATGYRLLAERYPGYVGVGEV